MADRFALIYGESNSGKTTEVERLAEWIFEAFGLKTRYCHNDSGFGAMATGIKEGFVDGLFLGELMDPMGTMSALTVTGSRIINRETRGFWPLKEQGDVVKDKGGKALWLPQGEKDMAKIGLYAFEGLQTISSLLLDELVEKKQNVGSNVIFSYDSTVEVASLGKVTFTQGAGSKGHIGHVQNKLLSFLIGSHTLPVKMVVWTGHENRGEDQFSGAVALGPASIGRAQVNQLTQKFEDSWHLQLLEEVDSKTKKIEMERRAWFRSHQPQEPALAKCTWPAKTSLSLSVAREVEEKWPQGYVPLTWESGIMDFYKWLWPKLF